MYSGNWNKNDFTFFFALLVVSLLSVLVHSDFEMTIPSRNKTNLSPIFILVNMPRKLFDTPFEALAAAVLSNDHPLRLLFDTAEHHAAANQYRAQRKQKKEEIRKESLLQLRRSSTSGSLKSPLRRDRGDDDNDLTVAAGGAAQEQSASVPVRPSKHMAPQKSGASASSLSAPKLQDTSCVEFSGGFDAVSRGGGSFVQYPWAQRRLAQDLGTKATASNNNARVPKTTRFSDFQKQQQQQQTKKKD